MVVGTGRVGGDGLQDAAPAARLAGWYGQCATLLTAAGVACMVAASLPHLRRLASEASSGVAACSDPAICAAREQHDGHFREA